MKKIVLVVVLVLASICANAKSFVFYVKAPECSERNFCPSVVGSFAASGWGNNFEMSLLTEGEYAGYYTVTIDSEDNFEYKIRDREDHFWENEILGNSTSGYTLKNQADGEWYSFENFSAETSPIVLDFSNPEKFRWQQCPMTNSGNEETDPLPDPNPNDPDMSQQHDMPVIYINTENYAPVVSKEEYLVGSYWLDARGVEGYTSVGSAEEPLPLQIKGRGNWTWNGFAKKPYRLKLDAKAGLLGLKKSKHFGLLAHSDDWSGWMKNTLGFTLSKQMGLAWTPDQRPVEVVLNNKYMGLYMLTELVRVDKDRVNIVEQPDLCTNADSLTGGWLVEIDNYGNQEPYAVPVYGDGDAFYVTPKTPEILNDMQSSYLRTEMQNITDWAYSHSENLYNVLDMRDAARFYLVQELMCDCEAYTGSCYLHKQMLDPVWHFGPVWDFGNAYNRYRFNESEDVRHQFQYVNPEFTQHLIPQLIQMPQMQEELKKAWNHWRYYDYEKALKTIADMYDAIHNAAGRDPLAVTVQQDINNSSLGWCIHTDIDAAETSFTSYFVDRVNWLTSLWGAGCEDVPSELDCRPEMHNSAYKILRDGKVIIIRNGVEYSVLGR